MRTCSLVISAILISALVLALAVIAVSADNPFVGIWKMNPAKSTFSGPATKSFTAKMEAQENGIKCVQDVVGADGKAFQRIWAAKYDGKDYPVTAPDQDAVTLKKPNANTTIWLVKKGGKEVASGKSVVSKDGKTWILTGGGRDEKGKAFTYSIFMEKQ
jgi:hypothetical protein